MVISGLKHCYFRSHTKNKIEFQFEKIDGKLEKYFPSSTNSKKFWSGEKEKKDQKNTHVLDWNMDDVLNWTIDDVYNRLVGDLKIDSSEAEILKEQLINGKVFS